MTNPFQLRWLQGWSFEVVLMEGNVQVEARGFGICLRTPLYPGESPQVAADRLVMAEDQRRRALYQAWIRDKTASGDALLRTTGLTDNTGSNPKSLVVVGPQPVAA